MINLQRTNRQQTKVFVGLVMLFILIVYISYTQNKTTYIIKSSTESDEAFMKFVSNYTSQKDVTPEEIKILKKTFNFNLEQRDAEDPELVEFVKTLIVKPFPKSERNLSNKLRTDFSQVNQSLYFDELLGKKRNGFYIEAGGYDGETYSNSLFFELERDWNGILIEAVKPLFNALISRKRHAYAINACIADKVSVGKMRLFSMPTLSGLEDAMGEKYRQRAKNEGYTFTYIYTPCFSLVTILKAIEVMKVDYFSLDVEGAECLVLDTFDFSKLDITAFSIEHSFYPETLKCIRKTMLSNKYKETLVHSHDVYYKKL